MMPPDKPVQQLLGMGALLLLALGCAVVLWPFLSALLWAAVVCYATWPIYLAYERAVGGRKALAAALMTLSVTLVLVVPFAIMVATLADSIGDLVSAASRILQEGPPPPPRWLTSVPVLGNSVAAYWGSLVLDAPALMVELSKIMGPAANLAVASGAVIGVGLLELGLSVFVTFFMYRHGRALALYVRESAERVAGPRAHRLLLVVGTTVEGTVYGLIGTALAQGLLAALGFWIAGVRQALLLGSLTFVLSFAPVGPPLVWGSVALWLLYQGALGWGIFVAIWGALLVSSIDNVLRPYLLARSNSLPLVLGLLGFLGGLLAFGFIGIFLGPTLLAVGYSLFLEWHAAETEDRTASATRRSDAS
jgi:predicted PurR-regulated permease PerM